MTAIELTILASMFFVAATLYTSVGHAGASGYVAAMALMGVAPAVMKPTALAINILVAALASLRWTALGRTLEWRALLPLVIGSVPAAYFAGKYQLSDQHYRWLVGAMLLAAGLKFLLKPRDEPTQEASQPSGIPWVAGVPAGGAVGALSGLTGTGGGIFLTPLLMLSGRQGVRQVSGITAPFILLNSIAALAGSLQSLERLPPELPILTAAALAGAVVGTQVGLAWVSNTTLQRLVGVVLLIAAGKFLLS
jgi:uncharacterized protein